MEFNKQITPTKNIVPFVEFNLNSFKTSTPQTQCQQVSFLNGSHHLGSGSGSGSSFLASTNKLKPKVNFHNINDLINNSDTENIINNTNNDSGYQSCSNSTLDKTKNKTQIINSIIHMIDAHNLAKQSKFRENANEMKLNNDDKHSSLSKKYRTAFNNKQKYALEQYFKQNLYPNSLEIEELSKTLGLGEYVIKVWFQNKRSRSKNKIQLQ
jgi:hypothetical protein